MIHIDKFTDYTHRYILLTFKKYLKYPNCFRNKPFLNIHIICIYIYNNNTKYVKQKRQMLKLF